MVCRIRVLPAEQFHGVERQHEAGQRVREDVVNLPGQLGPLGQRGGFGLRRLGRAQLLKQFLGPGLGGPAFSWEILVDRVKAPIAKMNAAPTSSLARPGSDCR